MKIVIFGGGGFIGSSIADRLLKDGHSIRIFERPRIPNYRVFHKDEAVEWCAGDMASTHDVGCAVAGMDVVLHLVSTTLPKNSNDDPIHDVQSNVVPTLHLLNAMVAHAVKKVVFISSGGTVYGRPLYLPVDEAHPTDPIASYGITKLTIEKYLRLYEHLHGIRSVTLRVSNPYGERQRIETAQGAVGVFLHRALSGLGVDIWGDGTITRDYIHVSDVAAAFSRAVEYGGDHRCFNIGSGQGTSLNELVVQIERALGIKISKNYLPQRNFDVPVNILSNQLARQELGWSPLVSMSEGLCRTAEWMYKKVEQSKDSC